MNKAFEDKRKSEIVKFHPSIIILEYPRQVGYPVWCGNECIEEYNRKQAEEHENRLSKHITKVCTSTEPFDRQEKETV